MKTNKVIVHTRQRNRGIYTIDSVKKGKTIIKNNLTYFFVVEVAGVTQ